MKYLLNGGTHHINPASMPEILEYLHFLKIKTIVFIPFASPDNQSQSRWLRPEQLLSGCGFELFVITPYRLDLAQARTTLERADAVFFPGGSQSLLLKRLHQTKLWLVLQKRLASGEIKAVIGQSAGEMVMGEKTIVGHVAVKSIVDGLNLLSGYIFDSHFSQRQRLPRLKRVVASLDYAYTGVGVDESTTLVMNESWEIERVLGQGTVTVCRQGKVEVYDSN